MAVERFPIEAGHIMMFARSIGDPNQIYYDADHASATEVGDIIAPPTFVQASAQYDPDYRLRPKIGEAWIGSGAGPTGIASATDSQRDSQSDAESRGPAGSVASVLHAEQHYEYHRHIGPGDVLTATVKPGETWEKQSKRAGLLSFTETITEFRDQNGELAITARAVGVSTEKPVTG